MTTLGGRGRVAKILACAIDDERAQCPGTHWAYNLPHENLQIVNDFLLAAVSSRTATASGTVLDVEDAVIPNAHIVFHWDPSGSTYSKDITGDARQDISVTTDKDGRFSAALKPGFYDVFVAATAFSPHCEKIRLKERG